MIKVDQQPLVSVIIPSYNHEKYIEETVNSVINQSYKNIELIIIDDGSKDQSVNLIEKRIDELVNRFTNFIFISRENKGLSYTLNEAINLCNGKYFSQLASDDLIEADKITKQVEYLERYQKCGIVYGGAYTINKDGNIVGKSNLRRKIYSWSEIYYSKYSIFGLTQLIRIECIQSLKSQYGIVYPPNIKIEDWYLLLRLSKLYEIHKIPFYFGRYRRHENNLSNNFKLMLHEKLKILKYLNEEKLNSAYSTVYLIAALESSKINFNFSKKCFLKAVKLDYRILLNINFIKYLIKIILSNHAIKIKR
jgi:alpha-1,3-rhamnosyltransferase